MKIFPSKRYLIAGLLTLVLTLLLSFNFGRTNLPATAQTSAANLIGTWNYEITTSSQIFQYQMQISNINGQLVGKYTIPSNNTSNFQIKIYESSLRGRPVLTIAQVSIDSTGAGRDYFATSNGRLDTNSLINGNFVDLDNNKGTFKMTKL
jgi:hypothetical protein